MFVWFKKFHIFIYPLSCCRLKILGWQGSGSFISCSYVLLVVVLGAVCLIMDVSDALRDAWPGYERVNDGDLYHVYEDPLEPQVSIYSDGWSGSMAVSQLVVLILSMI